jgi:DNA-binding IclR family transcriptional regulator
VLGVEDMRETAEVAVPVLDDRGQVRAVLCASGNPKTFSEEVLTTQVAPQLIRAARAAGRAIGDA